MSHAMATIERLGLETRAVGHHTSLRHRGIVWPTVEAWASPQNQIRNLPSGLKARPPVPELLVERKRVELGICASLPLSTLKQTTLLLPPTLLDHS